MKRFYQWVLAATLTCGMMTLTSCQGLVDAIFGEDAQPAESSKPSTDPKKPTTPTTFDAETTPLTLEALAANTVVTIKLMDGIELSSVDYSTDGTTWTALSSNPQKITLAAKGDKVMLRGANGSYAKADAATTITCSGASAATRGLTRTFTSKALCLVYGNIRSMLQKEGFSSIEDLTKDYTFRQFFMNADIDIDPEKGLLLPGGQLTTGCFEEMFKDNKNLSVAPVLSAEELVDYCYQGIFENCSSVSAVTMLATKVAAGAKDYLKDWLKKAGTDTATGEDPVLVVNEDSQIPVSEMTEDAGDNWVAVDAETEEIIPTGIEIKWGDDVLKIDEDTKMEMTEGDEKALTATLLPKEAEGEVTVSVTPEDILKIDIENGTVEALKAGTATVNAKYTNGDKEISVEFEVEVKAAVVKVTSITLTNTTAEVEVGSTVTLSVKAVAPNDATDPTYTWKSSDETKATVDQDGKVTGVATGTVTISAEANDGSGVKGECAVTVKVPAAASKALTAVTSSELGWRVCSDGKAYEATGSLPTGVSAVAMIAYVGSETGVDGYTHGLALALTDEASTMNWTNATGASGAAAHTPAAPTTTSSWMLPSKDQWEQMFAAFGGNSGSYTGLNTAIGNAGGTALVVANNGSHYWTSTKKSESRAYTAYLVSGQVGLGDQGMNYDYYVRACLAF